MSIRNLSNHSCSIIHLYAIDLVTTVKGTQQQVFSRKQANKPKDRLKGQAGKQTKKNRTHEVKYQGQRAGILMRELGACVHILGSINCCMGMEQQ